MESDAETQRRENNPYEVDDEEFHFNMSKLIALFKTLHGKMCFLRSRITPSIAVILLLGIATIWTNFNNHLWKEKHGVVIHDVVGYYSYLPAAVIHQDMKFDFVIKQPEHYYGHVMRLRTPDGSIYQKMTMGLAMLYLPFFLIGHVQALLTGAPATGVGEPYFFWLIFSSMTYAFIGLLLLRKIMLRFFNEKLIAFILMIIIAGTNLYYYITLEAAMSHAYNFFLFILFVWLTMRWHEKPTLSISIYAGLTYGLIGLIRPTNGLIAVFFLLYNITSFQQVTSRLHLFIREWKMILVIIFSAFIVVLPQLVFWKVNTGSWFFYTYGEEGFFFNNPQIWRGLFSYRKGWLLYTPVMIFALAGIFTLRKRVPSFFIPVLVFVILNTYVVFSWWDWSYGGSFGSRPMIDSYGLMAVSLASFTQTVLNRKRFAGILLQLVMVLMMAFSIFQILQYKYATIHYAFMTKEAYWHGFGKLKADAELYDLFESMDYPMLKKGIYKTRPTLRHTIGPDVINDFESLSPDSNHFMSPDQHYKFVSFGNQSNLEARSGTHSALLTGEKAFSSGINFPVKPGQKYFISAWKKPAESDGSLVFSSADAKVIYLPKSEIDSTDNHGWGRITMEVTIPDDFNNWCKVYVWNKSQDSLYFDDLQIIKLK